VLSVASRRRPAETSRSPVIPAGDASGSFRKRVSSPGRSGASLRVHARRAAVVLVASVAVLVPATAVAAPAPTVAGKATFGIGPANARGFDRRPYLNYDASPGARFTDHVVIRNYARTPVTLRLYPADGVDGADGAIAFASEGVHNVDAGSWITVAGHSGLQLLTLAPDGQRVLPISVAIPANATPGDHIAAVIVALRARAVGGQQKLNLDQRLALRALFRISGAVRPELRVERLTADYHDSLNPFGSGYATVGYTVHNTGNVILGGTQRVTVSGLFGTTGTVGALAAVPPLLPGATARVSVVVRHVWPELYLHARVTVTPLGLTGAADPGLRPITTTTGMWAIPWMLVLVVALLVAAVWLVNRWRKRPGSGGAHRAARGAPAPEPDLAGVA
jgi:hypothetical protein